LQRAFLIGAGRAVQIAAARQRVRELLACPGKLVLKLRRRVVLVGLGDVAEEAVVEAFEVVAGKRIGRGAARALAPRRGSKRRP
jgi:hypothetical protein